MYYKAIRWLSVADIQRPVLETNPLSPFFFVTLISNFQASLKKTKKLKMSGISSCIQRKKKKIILAIFFSPKFALFLYFYPLALQHSCSSVLYWRSIQRHPDFDITTLISNLQAIFKKRKKPEVMTSVGVFNRHKIFSFRKLFFQEILTFFGFEFIE